jgi:hypothetical protein
VHAAAVLLHRDGVLPARAALQLPARGRRQGAAHAARRLDQAGLHFTKLHFRGPMLRFLKIFSANKLAFLTQNSAEFCKKWIKTLFKKRNFSAKNGENRRKL